MSAYDVELHRAAEKFLDKLARSQPGDAEAVENAIENLATDPRPHGCKALQGFTKVLRVRVGGYRICYSVDDGQLVILVITISTRDDVYEELRRRIG